MSQSDYARIERALYFLAENYRDQPSLAQIAEHVHLSEFHFQRMFTQWVGISPKRFLQFLTIDHAKECLRDSESVLSASLSSGLSTSSRLHDLFIRYECVSPGEYKLRGAGLTIGYTYLDSIFGECLLMSNSRGVCGLAFTDGDRNHAFAEMSSRWPKATFVQEETNARNYAKVLSQIGTSRSTQSEIKLALYGTPFQLKVWEALLQLPMAARVNYSQVGELLGNPGAARAVGSAVGKNPLAWLIPCHSVIRSDGVLGGYHWGQGRKLALLGWESSVADNALSPIAAATN
ncbi:MAG: bifunctional helix-turn-helix domain-containing protein/methylated-DNA--[protein]-cysteine S-methyltransferase [Pseudomonadota bacterium]